MARPHLYKFIFWNGALIIYTLLLILACTVTGSRIPRSPGLTANGSPCNKLQYFESHSSKCYNCSFCTHSPVEMYERPECKTNNNAAIWNGKNLWCDQVSGPFPECPPFPPNMNVEICSYCRWENHNLTFSPGCVCTVSCGKLSAMRFHLRCTLDLTWNVSLSDISDKCQPTLPPTTPSHDMKLTSLHWNHSQEYWRKTVTGGLKASTTTEQTSSSSVVLIAVVLSLAVVVAVAVAVVVLFRRHRSCNFHKSSASDGSGDTDRMDVRSSAPLMQNGEKNGSVPNGPKALNKTESSTSGFLKAPNEVDQEKEVLIEEDHPYCRDKKLGASVRMVDEATKMTELISSVDEKSLKEDVPNPQHQGDETHSSAAALSKPEMDGVKVHTAGSIGSGDTETCRAMKALLNSRKDLVEVTKLFDQESNIFKTTWHTIARDILGWGEATISSWEYRIRPQASGSPGDGPTYIVMLNLFQQGIGLQELLTYLREHDHYNSKEAQGFLQKFFDKWRNETQSQS